MAVRALGADTVFTEEVVACRLAGAKARWNTDFNIKGEDYDCCMDNAHSFQNS